MGLVGTNGRSDPGNPKGPDGIVTHSYPSARYALWASLTVAYTENYIYNSPHVWTLSDYPWRLPCFLCERTAPGFVPTQESGARWGWHRQSPAIPL
jgi:hypothetical protein